MSTLLWVVIVLGVLLFSAIVCLIFSITVTLKLEKMNEGLRRDCNVLTETLVRSSGHQIILDQSNSPRVKRAPSVWWGKRRERFKVKANE